MKKKIIGIALITLALISLYGCGKDETSSSNTSDNSSNISAKSAIGDNALTDIINANKVLNIDIDVKEVTSTTVTAKVDETEIVETAESQNSPQKEIIKAEISPSKPNNQQPTQATTQAPTAPPTTQAPKQQPTPTQPPTTQAPTPTPPSTPSYIPTSSGYYGDRQVMVNMVNNYRASQGLSTLTYDSGWQIYADRLAKLRASQKLINHGYAMENIAGGGGTWDYETTFKGWQNSAGHNRTMLDQSGSQGKYIAFSAYYDASTSTSIYVLVIEDNSYQEHHDYVEAFCCEEWWENRLTEESFNWTEEQFKEEFIKRGYGKYYPHL